MKATKPVILSLATFLLIAACTNNDIPEKGFRVRQDTEENTDETDYGLSKDSLKFDTQPGDILLTGWPDIRLTPVYKVNIKPRDNSTFIGDNRYYYSYMFNTWNDNYMPGIEAVYGYNMVNVSFNNLKESSPRNFFKTYVLVRNIYFPANSIDSLNGEPVKRDYILISVYNQDTNNDGFINLKDLRRLYLFDLNGELKKAVIPENYSVFKSYFDEKNDYMYVYARLDENGNGSVEQNEMVHIFWVDMKNPDKTGRQY